MIGCGNGGKRFPTCGRSSQNREWAMPCRRFLFANKGRNSVWKEDNKLLRLQGRVLTTPKFCLCTPIMLWKTRFLPRWGQLQTTMLALWGRRTGCRKRRNRVRKLSEWLWKWWTGSMATASSARCRWAYGAAKMFFLCRKDSLRERKRRPTDRKSVV